MRVYIPVERILTALVPHESLSSARRGRVGAEGLGAEGLGAVVVVKFIPVAPAIILVLLFPYVVTLMAHMTAKRPISEWWLMRMRPEAMGAHSTTNFGDKESYKPSAHVALRYQG